MKIKNITTCAVLLSAAAMLSPALSSCSGKKTSETKAQETEAKAGGPQLGTTMQGPAIDKSADSTLQAMIKTEVPKFIQLVYQDQQTGKSLTYNLYSPKNGEASKKYPLVLFMGDATTAGNDAKAALTQGYGALVWVTDEAQAKNPCYVLVPQFTGVAINDKYERTPEVDMVARLVKDLAGSRNIDTQRLYTTGQSMGGMISMYYNVAYPELFAASVFVDSHYDKASFDKLAKHKFVYFIAGEKGKAYECLKPLQQACETDSVQYTFASWPASLPEARQDELAATMLEKGAPVNFFEFEPGTIVPEGKDGSEHMYSFDYAYRNRAVRDWLFKQSR